MKSNKNTKTLVYFEKIEYNIYMKKIVINKKENAKKISKIILENTSIGYNTFCKLLRKKDIKINGRRISKDTKVYENDCLEIYIDEEKAKDIKINNILEIYQDNNVLIVNKPIGIEVVGKYGVEDILRTKYGDVFACHRLDRNTSGLVIFAKNLETLKILEDKFRNNEIEKKYITQVNGIFNIPEKEEIAYLFKDSKKAFVYIEDIQKNGYKKIITKYKEIEKNKELNISILEIELKTGRTHQIRAHMAHLGHPVIGDGKYGDYIINKKFGKKHQILVSYYLKFDFKSNSGILEYLKDKEIYLDKGEIYGKHSFIR